MKPGKLYLKIFLSFLAILFITEISIFALFVMIPGKDFRAQLEHYTKGKVLIVKEIVEDKIRSAPTTELSKNEPLRKFISDFGEILGAKVWLQNSDGTLSVKSFEGGVPVMVEQFKEKRSRDYGSFKLYRRRHSHFYAVIPIAFPKGEKGSIHILFGSPGPFRPEGGFALGLAMIGLIVALLIIPVSRLITDRVKQLKQSALRIAEGDLSHRAAVKGKDEIGELAQALNHMTDKLERMITSSKELTANVSHELRTPLTRIRVAEELLREKLEKGNLKEYERHLDEIREDISELDRLTGRILELSKLDIQESPLKFESLNPSDLINDLLERLKPVMERKDLRVKTDLSSDSPLMGDREALRLALLNILDNAAKFTPPKGDIIVKMYSQQGFLEISITNSFEKLAEEDLTRIFDPFHRTGRSKAAGSGLGLTITKKIIGRHGGKIESFNSPEGLEIRIRLPAGPGRNPGEVVK
jgi:two-component system sensor histidine kinase CpxA